MYEGAIIWLGFWIAVGIGLFSLVVNDIKNKEK